MVLTKTNHVASSELLCCGPKHWLWVQPSATCFKNWVQDKWQWKGFSGKNTVTKVILLNVLFQKMCVHGCVWLLGEYLRRCGRLWSGYGWLWAGRRTPSQPSWSRKESAVLHWRSALTHLQGCPRRTHRSGQYLRFYTLFSIITKYKTLIFFM